MHACTRGKAESKSLIKSLNGKRNHTHACAYFHAPAFVRALIPAEQQVSSCVIVVCVSLLIYRIQPIKAWSLDSFADAEAQTVRVTEAVLRILSDHHSMNWAQVCRQKRVQHILSGREHARRLPGSRSWRRPLPWNFSQRNFQGNVDRSSSGAPRGRPMPWQPCLAFSHIRVDHRRDRFVSLRLPVDGCGVLLLAPHELRAQGCGMEDWRALVVVANPLDFRSIWQAARHVRRVGGVLGRPPPGPSCLFFILVASAISRPLVPSCAPPSSATLHQMRWAYPKTRQGWTSFYWLKPALTHHHESAKICQNMKRSAFPTQGPGVSLLGPQAWSGPSSGAGAARSMAGHNDFHLGGASHLTQRL